MKKEYLRPEAEIVSFLLNEAITADTAENDEWVPLEGSEGHDVW